MSNDDKEMIMNPDSWPCWPHLPVKRYTVQGQCPIIGFLFDSPQSKNTVFHANMFCNDIDFSTVEKSVYGSVEEMLRDGWMVD